MANKSSRKNYIAHYRNLRDLTQEELAESIGTSQTQIMRLENGLRKFTMEWAEKLATPLLCSPIDLLFGPDQELSSEERQAITTFRTLPPDERNNFLVMMEAVSRKWKNETKN